MDARAKRPYDARKVASPSFPISLMRILASLRSPLSRIATAVTFHAFMIGSAFAQFGADIPDIQNTPEGGSGQTRDSIVQVINFILTFLALVAVIFVIIGGFRILAAAGNDEQITKGRKTIIYAIVGLLIVFFARVIVGFFTGEIAGIF